MAQRRLDVLLIINFLFPFRSRRYRRTGAMRKYVTPRAMSRGQSNGVFNTIHLREEHVTVTDEKDVHLSVAFALNNFVHQPVHWDYYKINCIVMTVYPEQTGTFPHHPGLRRPINYAWIDYDDDDRPQFVPYNWHGIKHWMADEKFSMKLYPRLLTSSGQASFKPNAIVKGGWINSTYPDTQYLGIKLSFGMIRPQGTGKEMASYKIVFKAYVSYKHPIYLNPSK